jgi:hypothetical protein
MDQSDQSPVIVREPMSDEELTALALSADPNAPLDPNAVPWYSALALQRGLLPDWYMPIPSASHRGKGTRIVIGVLVVGFLTIGAFGLCITSGFLSLA